MADVTHHTTKSPHSFARRALSVFQRWGGAVGAAGFVAVGLQVVLNLMAVKSIVSLPIDVFSTGVFFALAIIAYVFIGIYDRSGEKG
jgi:hypothetical protein